MAANHQEIERWGIIELTFNGPALGNPFLDVKFGARFFHRHFSVEVAGFYDGEGKHKVRFSPDMVGEWRYVTISNVPVLDGLKDDFICTPPGAGNHGPVSARDRFHLTYADGTPHFSCGTTCYAWIHQPDELQEQTLQTLKTAPFNKLRMCVFPKHYTYNTNEPPVYPFEWMGDRDWDFTRFNPVFFQRLEKRIGDLLALGIEADVILFHPYDRWGFADMGKENNHRYLRYLIARIAAYRNVWWSLANEYDLMHHQSVADWDDIFRLIQEEDPYQRLRSVHNWIMLEQHDNRQFYDYRKPWVTHCSIQHAHADRVNEWRELYHKPVILDEVCYEGNIPSGWGNLSGQELTRRFWEATARGGYCGHSETYLDEHDVLWWSKGGVLKGSSPARIAFLRRIWEESFSEGLTPLGEISDTCLPSSGKPGEYYLTYFGLRQPGEATFRLPEGMRAVVDVIDTWDMTVTRQPGIHMGTVKVTLPTKPYMAVRILNERRA